MNSANGSNGADKGSSACGEPVAIVGMGCRWPGGIRDASGLWDLLKNKQSGYQEFGPPRFSTQGFYHPNSDHPGTMATRGGFLVDEDARLFDGAFFGINGLEVETMDPSQRKLIEVCYEALENAGETLESVSGSRTGVFVGNFALDHWIMQSRDWDYPRPYALTGAAASISSNRISYLFNLQGPSLTLDTACSSSMYAIHLAVNAIRSGDCDSAVVAASNWIMDPSLQMALDKLGALSATSTCHTFDASVDGYARGEGFAALYLKKVTHAVAQEAPIRAIIRGTAANANGRTGGITRPSALGQEAVIRRAYDNAGLSLDETGYFECHGTGTPVGDPIEVAAVSNVFAPTRSDAPEDCLLIGSVKTNLGHTEGASALASIMKVVLALEHGQIPPTVGVEDLNPDIDFAMGKVKVVQEITSWPCGRLPRASINSFGFGGANGHVIIEHVSIVLPKYVQSARGAPSERIAPRWHNGVTINRTNGTNGVTNGFSKRNHAHNGLSLSSTQIEVLPRVMKADATTRQLVVLPFSSHIEASLKLNIDALARVIDHDSVSMADVAYTLSCRRSRYAQRTFRIVNRESPTEGLDVAQRVIASPIEPAIIGFIFTGQGAQWHAMGANLWEYRVFRTAIAYVDQIIAALPTQSPQWSVADIVTGKCAPELIQNPEVSQMACTAVQIGLVDLLASWEVKPTAVAGHSSGEMAAAYASGHITAAEAITAAFYRGQAVSMNMKSGAMLAVGLGAEDVAEYLEGLQEENMARVACINSPTSVTLSGDANIIQTLSEALTAKGIFNRILKTGGNAYHSHHMAPLGMRYIELLSTGLDHIRDQGLVDSRQRYPLIYWASSTTPAKSLSETFDQPSYWRSNLELPVCFSEAVQNMLATKTIDVLVEIGPHAALKGPLEQIVKGLGKSVAYVPSLKREVDARVSMLQLVGVLFGHNAAVDLTAVNATDDDAVDGNKPGLIHGCTAVNLPPYQYSYGPVSYHESRVSKEYRLRSEPRHDLLGSKVLGTAKLRPQWRNILRLKDLPWMADHRLLPDVVFPAAAYFCMAIEAASRIYRELAGAQPLPITGYSLRNVAITSALKIPEDDHGVEIVMSMNLGDPAAAATDWMPFSISSVTRGSEQWTEHCAGHARLHVSTGKTSRAATALIDQSSENFRSFNTGVWYQKFSEIGLGYGPAFQALSDLRAHPDEGYASAKVALKTTVNTIKGGESPYALHPASLDAIFQLGLIACHGGQVEKAQIAHVPIHLDNLYLRNDNERMSNDSQEVKLNGHSDAGDGWATGVARGELRGLRGAYVQLQLLRDSGNVLLEIDCLRCISYGETRTSSEQTKDRAYCGPFSRLVWKPDVRTLPGPKADVLFPPPEANTENLPVLPILERIASLMVVETYQSFVCSKDGPQLRPSGSVGHFLDWIKRLVHDNGSELIITAKELSDDARRDLINSLCASAGDLVEVRIASRLLENMDDILHERQTGLDVLLHDGLLAALYETGLYISGAYPQLFSIMDSLAHVDPHLRILEVGAGTGGATRIVMKALTEPSTRIKRYTEYTFTDVSPGFLTAARELLVYPDVQFSVLDIERDPLAQGFGPTYDVVLASQTLHATGSIDKTLQNCRKLLKPGGKLVLVDNTRNSLMVGFFLGTLTGYWHGIPDGRIDAPFLDVSQWDSALRRNGFSGTEMVLGDYPTPQRITTVLMSSAVDSTRGLPSPPAGGMVHLLNDTQSHPAILAHLAQELTLRGFEVRSSSLVDALGAVSPNARIVAFLDAEALVASADAQHLAVLQHLARNAVNMVWVTSCGIARGRCPDGAFVTGLLRTIGIENPGGRFVSIDIDAEGFNIEDNCLITAIADHAEVFQQDSLDGFGQHVVNNESRRFGDNELVWQDGCMWVSRVVADTALAPFAETRNESNTPGGRIEMALLDSQGPVRAVFETAGILSSLYFRSYTELSSPLPRDYIEVKVAAVGLNWKDLGLCSGRFDANNLSSEYAGVVTKLGGDVEGLQVGDPVYGMGRGHFGNYTRVPAAFSHKLVLRRSPGSPPSGNPPSDDSMVDMATMPLVYMTAIYAFEHVARLCEGHKVLVQSATGGLGLAAIQIARAKGAEVYATVGSPDKARFLEQSVGIPATHIFSSRDSTDMARAVAVTRTGFDVILSTSKGDVLYASGRALAPLGHLIDVGRMDVMDSKTIGLELFQKSANFSSFDLSLVLDSNPIIGKQLISAVDKLYIAGKIDPIRPVHATDVSQLDKVLLGFSKGKHVGKLVVTFQKPETLVRMLVPSVSRVTFDPEARYIVTGGVSGLGRTIVKWMGDRGARDFVVLSRRGGGGSEAQSLVDTLGTRGIRVEVVQCDVSCREQVARVVGSAMNARPQRLVKGVVHAAVSYNDISFDQLDMRLWREGMAAKVAGTKNLHEATATLPLDFFVMTTSGDAFFAPPTQSVYTAANNFQDAFARWRRGQGLPASTVLLTLVDDIGSSSTLNSATSAMFDRLKVPTITESELLRRIEPAFLNPAPADTSTEGQRWTGQLRDPLSAANVITCLDPAALAAKQRELNSPQTGNNSSSMLAPRWYGDGRVAPVMRAIDDAQRHHADGSHDTDSGGAGSSSSSTDRPGDAGRVRRKLRAAVAAGPDQRAETVGFVTDSITVAVAGMLFVDVAAVNSARPVAAQGVDSLIASELRNWFLQALGANISMLDLLDASTSIAELAQGIVDEAYGAVSDVTS